MASRVSSRAPVRYAPIGIGSEVQTLAQHFGAGLRVSRSDIYGYGHALPLLVVEHTPPAGLPSVAYVCGGPHTSESHFPGNDISVGVAYRRTRVARLARLTSA